MVCRDPMVATTVNIGFSCLSIILYYTPETNTTRICLWCKCQCQCVKAVKKANSSYGSIGKR